ncbi:MAG: class II SORL domain-containing protein [Desulforegulaceae bacterium]|nr:class II SORL domain-containing protein [Desulforegulaceae bacterium]
MSKIGEFYQSGDWKNEKHIPIINCKSEVSADSPFEVTLSIGDEIAHPNTTEHHIRWIKLYFKPEGEKFIYELSSFDFAAHGESAKGANEGSSYSEPFVTTKIRLKSSGQLIATSYCNIHGLWESSAEIKVS